MKFSAFDVNFSELDDELPPEAELFKRDMILYEKVETVERAGMRNLIIKDNRPCGCTNEFEVGSRTVGIARPKDQNRRRSESKEHESKIRNRCTNYCDSSHSFKQFRLLAKTLDILAEGQRVLEGVRT